MTTGGRAKREATVEVPGIGRVVAHIEQVYSADGSLELEVLQGATRVHPEPLTFLETEDEFKSVANALGISH